ncbi:sigma-70 family RNA polymerase sigma factor [Pseudaestuariivita rosea]|uniref:sigma-70 family RNA polymerase sigma factor n=1 Tax=Pseudaestuariivita rosea TaxID=2763263 RepID=UPI001ABAFBCF|nr:sigma-70 family RNA polymerase sigma factor [Pseudaestuariivita rosea]
MDPTPDGMMSDESDEALLVRYISGDTAAARLLTMRLTPVIYAYAYRMLGRSSDVDDIVQDAMLRLWKHAPKWRQDEAKVSTWLYRVTSNLCIDHMRKKKHDTIDQMPEIEDDQPLAEDRLQSRHQSQALHQALLELPGRQRQAVILRHLDGLANPQIADIMDISVDAVESLTSRGKRRLAELLSDKKEVLGYVR